VAKRKSYIKTPEFAKLVDLDASVENGVFEAELTEIYNQMRQIINQSFEQRPHPKSREWITRYIYWELFNVPEQILKEMHGVDDLLPIVGLAGFWDRCVQCGRRVRVGFRMREALRQYIQYVARTNQLPVWCSECRAKANRDVIAGVVIETEQECEWWKYQ